MASEPGPADVVDAVDDPSLPPAQDPPPCLDAGLSNRTWLETNFPCRAACPVGTNAGGYTSLVAAGRYEEAYALARGPNPLASICGRVCAHPCEAACRRRAIDAPVSIRAIKRFVTERYGCESSRKFEEIYKVVEKPRPRLADGQARRVAVIGAGPAGLACAHDLALMGHRVTIFDLAPVAGGMMTIGIPEYRLPRELVQSEVDFVRWLGVELRLGSEIGRDPSFEEVVRSHDAVFLATGCRKGKGLPIPGADAIGVLTAVDFLAAVNLGTPVEIGESVVVIGGGSVAYDAARSVRRFGGTVEADEQHHNLVFDAALTAARTLRRKVTMVALEALHEMPADADEIAEGREEGIELLQRRGPKEIVCANGRARGLVTLRVARVFDEKGKFSPVTVPGSEAEIPADTIIVAVGQVADLSFLGADHGLRVGPRQTIDVDRQTLANSRPGVYAGGDVAFGPRIIIEAVADGRRAATSIDTFLTGRTDEPVKLRMKRFPTFGYDHPFARGDYECIGRSEIPTIPVAGRAGQATVEIGYSEEQAREAGRRCLHCWINTIFDSSRMRGTECIQCGGCVDVCPEECIDLVKLVRLAGRAEDQPLRMPDGSPLELSVHATGGAMVKDETACIRCGLCARRCPTGVITMVGFYRADEAETVAGCEEVL
ncbi:MAG: FAD-dependent oxidoreductase [Candidatus Riflebacteria bacterium]|nr:FAD-dependent oxidoreductase [Candidatus Riflebacteria bacterium]